MNKICYECFRAVENECGVCPYCQFDFRHYKVSERALRPGTILNEKYTIGRTLGEGGFGITYLAWNNSHGAKIAIKEYYPKDTAMRNTTLYGSNTLHVSESVKNGSFESGLQRYAREADILKRFSSLPGVVSVWDFFYQNGTAYIVMEYVDGISLREFIQSKGGKLTVNETLNIMEPVISALAVIHKNMLLHRDISPDNIMISRDGRIKLIDFGAARYFTDDTQQSMTVVLKHGYAPIEQYSRKSEQGTWTDVYALSAVLYRMMTGIVPDEAPGRVNKDGLIPVRKLNKKVPKHIAAAITKGLAIQPKNRYQDMEGLYGDLYLTQDELKEMRRHRAAVTAVMLVFVGVAAVVIAGEVRVMISMRQVEQAQFSGETAQVQFSDSEPEMKTEPEPQMLAAEIHSEAETQTQDADMQYSGPEVQTADIDRDEENKMLLPIIRQHDQTEQESGADTQQQYAVVVVRDGYLTGRSEAYTVGNILDMYSDTTGNWYGGNVSTDTTKVYYQGTKNGDIFTVEFEVYTDNTFKLTGVDVNNESVENYSSYFQQILNDVGV